MEYIIRNPFGSENKPTGHWTDVRDKLINDKDPGRNIKKGETMGESQSRYSIIERLTQTKLDIMSAKSELKEGLKHKEEKITEFKKDLENWNKDIEEDVKRERRNRERLIEKAKHEFENTKERLTEKENVYDQKIKSINEALSSIEEMSKTAPTIQAS